MRKVWPMLAGLLVVALVALAALGVFMGTPTTEDPGRARAPGRGEGVAESREPDVGVNGGDGRVSATTPVRFLAFGDAGTGDEKQRALGEGAQAVCAREGCDFVLMLGDNIYPTGAESPFDTEFVERFEVPFDRLAEPFYVALGNHDVKGKNPAGNDSGDHMVAYSQRLDRYSPRWIMPDREYAFEKENARFVVLDSTDLADETSDPQGVAAALAWLQANWGDDDAWHVVAAHHPYISNGEHGAAGSYDDEDGLGQPWRDVLEQGVCGKADLYLSGHDHVLEWLVSPPACAGTQLVVSGAAASPRPIERTAFPVHHNQGDVQGFFWFEIDGPRLVGRMYDLAGNVLFERVVEKGDA